MLTFSFHGLCRDSGDSYKSSYISHYQRYSSIDEFLDWIEENSIQEMYSLAVLDGCKKVWSYEEDHEEGSPSYEIFEWLYNETCSRNLLAFYFRCWEWECIQRKKQLSFSFAENFLSWAFE